MSKAPDQIEQLLRPVFEARATIAWAAASIWVMTIGWWTSMSPSMVIALTAITALMGLIRGTAARRLLTQQLALIGRPIQFIDAKTLIDTIPKMGNNIWLGWGWSWQPSHTRKAYEVLKRDLKDIYPAPWLMKLMGEKREPQNERGLQWVHGLEPVETDILAPIDSLRGHCAIVAVTGAMKTRLMALLVTQLVARGDVVIGLDPKGDKDLEKIFRQAAESTGVPGKFLKLHPAFASESIRLDLLKNWDRVSQVASRIKLVLGAGDSGDNFAEFCWLAVHRITNGVKYVGRRVSLYTLKNAIESRSTVEKLTHEALRQFFRDRAPSLLDRVEQEQNKQSSSKPTASGKRANVTVETSIPELTAMIAVFISDVPENPTESEETGLPMKPDEIRGLVMILEANKEWFGKMIISITPLLTKLTTDDLNSLLSPDYTDIDDERPIMDMKRVVEGGHALYIGTDGLADPSVGKAMAAMTIAELASVAAEIYNYGLESDQGKAPRKIHLFVDEWGDCMCEPLVQQANKGRGAGIFIWALGQTFSDLVVAFGGDTHSASRFLGNMNNMIVGATKDVETVEVIAKQFGETLVPLLSMSTSTGSKTEDPGLEYSASQGKSTKETMMPLIPATIFSQLPDLQYIAMINRSMYLKGRFPVVRQ